MLDDIPPHLIRAILGFVAGIALGFVARRGRFCALGAIEDAVYAADTRRIRTWLLAIAVAITGTYALTIVGGLDLTRSIHTGPRLDWGGVIIGGLLFGFGMALVGTCGFGSLLRLGGGDLKAFVTFLVVGISAYMSIGGLTGLLRVRLLGPLSVDLQPLPSQRLDQLIGTSRIPSGAIVGAVALLFLIAALSDSSFRRSARSIATGAAIGILVTAGWWITGILGNDAFEEGRIVSFSFVRPLGETVMYGMLASGMPVEFGVGAVLGVVSGALLEAVTAGQFRWEAPDDAREMRRHILGAFLMGTGGVAALGCTIGQGIAGLSTLSLGSFLATAAIVAGARVGLYVLVEQ